MHGFITLSATSYDKTSLTLPVVKGVDVVSSVVAVVAAAVM